MENLSLTTTCQIEAELQNGLPGYSVAATSSILVSEDPKHGAMQCPVNYRAAGK